MRVLKLSLFIAMVMAVAACAGPRGDTGAQGPQGPAAPVVAPPAVDPVDVEIAQLLSDENEYRLGLGQTVLSSGLSCQMWTITAGDRIQSSISGHDTLTGLTSVTTWLLTSSFNQPNGPVSDGLSILPTAVQYITNMYLVRCQGQIVVTESGFVKFELASDDGSLLYIDGSKLIDNDNNHGITNVSGMKYLRKGVHAFRLDFAQTGGGNQALILKANGDVIDSRFFAH